MENKILVSVCIPAYNHEKTIKQSINSVLEQDVNFKYEIIIGDDCSTDNTAKILKENYKTPEIRLILRKKNLGGTKNFADIIQKAKGKYLILLEGDDYWEHNDTLQYMVDFLEAHDDFVGISAKRKRVDYYGKLLGDNADINSRKKILTLKDFLNNEVFDLGATLFRNRVIDIDLKNMVRASRNSGDFWMCVSILEQGKLYLTSKYLGVYRYVKRKGSSNYNSMHTRWEIYVDTMHVIQNMEKYHYPKHRYQKWYQKQTDDILHYIFEQKNMLVYIIKLIRLLGFIKFIKIIIVFWIKPLGDFMAKCCIAKIWRQFNDRMYI